MINMSPPEHIAYILSRLTEKGHAAVLVGGCVRDAIMGRLVHDWDVATSAAPADVARLFPKTVLTGERFGTVTVLTAGYTVEVTTFRVEGEYNDSRRPSSVEFVVNLDEDLSRRDFTMNAMAMMASGDIIDPYGGAQDIENRVIRCVGDPDIRFSEDALRMFRAFRFRAVLGFTIESGTLGAICANADKARLISAERVKAELEKTLMSQEPEIAGEMIISGLLDRYINIPGKKPYGLEKIKEFPLEPAMRWCAFCAVLLEERFISSAAEFLRGLRLDGKTAGTCVRALSISSFPDERPDIKRLLSKYGEDAVRCTAAICDAGIVKRLTYLDETGRTTCPAASFLAKTDAIIESGECYSLKKLAVTGSDLIGLGYAPGRELGEILKKLLDHVISRPEDNTRETLLLIAK